MKSSVSDLALFGGTPTFTDVLHVGRPNLGDRAALLARIGGALDRNWLTNDGPLVQEFEARVAAAAGVRHCVAACNGTSALEIAIRSAALRGEVIVPSFTFVATVHALQWQGITPVFCDIRPETHTLDPDLVEALITPATTAILGVHLWGTPCDIDALDWIARRHGLSLLFDAAHALGSTHQGAPVGSFGDAEIFSFHATKFVNSFEGGAVTTNDDDLARQLRLTRNFGFAGYDDVVCLGTNAKMNEFSAAMGLTSLDALDHFVEVNERNYRAYAKGLSDLGPVLVLPVSDGEKRNFQYVVLEVSGQETALRRDRLMEILWAENVRARRYFYPGVHNMEPYRTLYPNAGAGLPVTEGLAERVLVMPTGTSVGPDDIDRVCDLIRFAVFHAEEIEERASGPDPAARLRSGE